MSALSSAMRGPSFQTTRTVCGSAAKYWRAWKNSSGPAAPRVTTTSRR